MENYEDVVLTTRIRLARNINGYNFPNNMIDKKRKELVKELKNKVGEEYTVLELENMDDVTKKSLVETHTISKELLDGTGTALILDENNNITCMVNEEDHLRIQVFEKGFDLHKAYEEIITFDNALSKKLDYSYNEDYGYITACPTCIGTGMRVSVMLHLPALEKVGALDKIFNEISNLGISIRGMYGENTQGEGSIYQISNQKTLGLKYEDILQQVEQVTNYIIKQERKARDIIKNRITIKDEIYRSYGILNNALIISKKEALKLLSNVRLGVDMELLSDLTLENVDKVIKNIGANTLKKNYKEDFSKENEDIKRAEYIKSNM